MLLYIVVSYVWVLFVVILSICIVLGAFVVVISICLLYVSLGSRDSPSIFGFMFMGSVMLSICSSSCVLYSAGYGVKRVHAWVENEVVCLSPCMYFM